MMLADAHTLRLQTLGSRFLQELNFTADFKLVKIRMAYVIPAEIKLIALRRNDKTKTLFRK